MIIMMIYVLVMLLLNIIAIMMSGHYVIKAILSLGDDIAESKPAAAQRRTHTAIKTSNYDDSYNSRYDIYKNEKTGLYEPQKPHRGIDIKKPKED